MTENEVQRYMRIENKRQQALRRIINENKQKENLRLEGSQIHELQRIKEINKKNYSPRYI